VTSLFHKIEVDARHGDVASMLKKPMEKRLYPEWGMGMVSLDSPGNINRPRLVRLLKDVRVASNTSKLSVEARVLLRDFTLQVAHAA
jgi:hypothetical protein